MKRMLVLAAAMVLAGLTGSSATAAPPLGKELLDLESHVKWSAVDGAWKSLRDGWVRATAACDDAACANDELGIGGLEIDKQWKVRRSGWVRDCRAATSVHDVAKLLVEFEENMRWRAVDEGWKERRESWVAELKG